MQFFPPADAWYSESAARELGAYAVCLREGDNRVVHVTRMPRAMLNHAETYGDLIYMGRVARFITTIREVGTAGTPNPNFDPMPFHLAVEAAPIELSGPRGRAGILDAALDVVVGASPATEQPAPAAVNPEESEETLTALQQITASHRDSPLWGLPLGVVLNLDAVTTILASWERVNVPSWADAIAQLRSLIGPDVTGQLGLFIFVDDHAPLGATWLPAIPYGFYNETLTFRRWRIRQSTQAEDMWRISPVLAQPLHSRQPSHKVVDGIERVIRSRQNLWLAMMGTVPSLAAMLEEPITVFVQQQEEIANFTNTIGVVHLGQRLRQVRRTADVIAQIFEFSVPRAEEEDDDDDDVATQAAAAPLNDPFLDAAGQQFHDPVAQARRDSDAANLRAAERLATRAARREARREPTMEEVFGLDLTPNERAERQQRNRRGPARPAINTPAQRSGAARRASAAVRTTAMRHGNIDWDQIDTWRTASNQAFNLNDLSDQEVWNAVLYCVRDRVALHVFYASGDDTDVVPECWLRDRPLFQALVQHAVRRELTFPTDVFDYLRNFVLETVPDPGDEPPPWKNPAAAAEQEELRRQLAQRPLPQPPSADRRPGRRLDI